MLAHRALAQEQNSTGLIQVVGAPEGGWNTRDNIGSMLEIDAIELDNFFPDTGGVKNRNGHTEWATSFGTGGTIAEFRSGSTRTGIAGAGGKIWSFNSTTAAQAPVELGTGFSNNRWQTRNFKLNLMFVNGADVPQIYDGSTLGAMTITGDLSGSESGIDGITDHKSRVYMWNTGEAKFYYGDVNAIAGDFTEFPLDRVASGNLLIMTTVSFDTGNGLDDFAAFIMDNGEVLLYQGSNPGSASDWSLMQRYEIPRPIDVRGVARFGGDAILITETDFLPLLAYATAKPENRTLSKLSGAVKAAVDSFETNSGWEAHLYNKGKWLFMNVPVGGSSYEQYVFNTVTRAATRFTGMDGSAWGVVNDRLFLFKGTVLYRADDGLNDDDADIDLHAKQAFTFLQNPNNKAFSRFDALIESRGTVNLSYTTAVDFGQAQTAQTTSSESTGTPWGSPWSSPWSSEIRTKTISFEVSAKGRSISAILDVSIKNQELAWLSSNYSFDIQVG